MFLNITNALAQLLFAVDKSCDVADSYQGKGALGADGDVDDKLRRNVF